jgi:hypothetical protein
MEDRASFTSSSLKGLMMAMSSFMKSVANAAQTFCS